MEKAVKVVVMGSVLVVIFKEAVHFLVLCLLEVEVAV